MPDHRTLDERDVTSNPFDQLKIWLQDAADAGIAEPNAMSLATTASDGRPSVRTVLLKGIEERSLLFYTNYQSRKGGELASNPNAALLFYWNVLERQVRVEGRATRTTPEESYEYFKTRPLLSRISAWASQQSTVVKTREELEKEFAHYMKQYEDGNVPLPPAWGGFRIVPETFEFWQGRENRLHDRLRYRKNDEGKWIIERLSP